MTSSVLGADPTKAVELRDDTYADTSKLLKKSQSANLLKSNSVFDVRDVSATRGMSYGSIKRLESDLGKIRANEANSSSLLRNEAADVHAETTEATPEEKKAETRARQADDDRKDARRPGSRLENLATGYAKGVLAPRRNILNDVSSASDDGDEFAEGLRSVKDYLPKPTSASSANAAKAAKKASERKVRRATVRAHMRSHTVRAGGASASAEASSTQASKNPFKRLISPRTRNKLAAGKAMAAAVVPMVLLLMMVAATTCLGFSIGAKSSSYSLEGLNANERIIATYLFDKDLDKVQVAAIMGNLRQESNCDPTATQVPGRTGGGIGLCQWGYGVDGGRGDLMDAWATSINRTWSDTNVQLDWMWAEMCNEGNAAGKTSWYNAQTSPKSFERFCAMTDVEKATDFWQTWIEGAGDVQLAKRIEYARGYLAIFNKGAGISSESRQSILTVANEVAGWATPYVFGGTDIKNGCDCSYFTQYCYLQAGIEIPRQSEAQKAAGTEIPISEAQPGDLLWMYGHVGIYLDENTVIEQTPAYCRINPITYNNWTCAVRIVD